MYLIAGLGNPGKAYMKTKHNVGFMVIDELSARLGLKVTKIKHKALIAECSIAGEKAILAKPQTYMNLSGLSLRGLSDYYKIEPQQLIVIYDDIDLNVGKLRIRKQGSSGTHNGMRSVVAQMSSEDFPRIRIGIGSPGNENMADFVTGHFSKTDKETIEAAVKNAADAVEVIIGQGIDKAMNEYNIREKKDKDSKPND